MIKRTSSNLSCLIETWSKTQISSLIFWRELYILFQIIIKAKRRTVILTNDSNPQVKFPNIRSFITCGDYTIQAKTSTYFFFNYKMGITLGLLFSELCALWEEVSIVMLQENIFRSIQDISFSRENFNQCRVPTVELRIS